MNTDCCDVNAAFECLNKKSGFQPPYIALKPSKNKNKILFAKCQNVAVQNSE